MYAPEQVFVAKLAESFDFACAAERLSDFPYSQSQVYRRLLLYDDGVHRGHATADDRSQHGGLAFGKVLPLQHRLLCSLRLQFFD